MARFSAEAWRPLLMQFAGDIPVNFLVDFIDMESGGQPCARGMCNDNNGQTCSARNPNCTGCDSPNATFNREAGIFQTDHPGDDRYGATSPQLRAACTGTSERQTRPLTQAEKELQIRAGINYIQAQRVVARNALAGIGANWPETSADFWMLVKSRHGLQTIATELLPVVARMLGHAPVNWSEFTTAYRLLPGNMIPASLQGFFFAQSEHRLRNRLDDVIANAEAAGRNAGPRIPSTGATSVPTAQNGMSTGAKVAAGAAAVAGVAGLSWLALRVAKHVAERGGTALGKRRRRKSDMLGATDVKRAATRQLGLGAHKYYAMTVQNPLSIAEVAKRWAKESDKAYDAPKPHVFWYPIDEVLKYREYDWSRTRARRDPEEWDALKEDMRESGWTAPSSSREKYPGTIDPAHIQVGKNGKVKVGEGNHRLAIAKELGIKLVPVQFHFRSEVESEEGNAHKIPLDGRGRMHHKRHTSTLDATDVKLIKRVAQLISYDVSKQDIRAQLIAEGYDDDDIFQAHQAAKVYLRRREIPDSNY